MTDDLQHGKRDANGHWKPAESIRFAPLFSWPPKPLRLIKWFFSTDGYLLPWNLIYFGIAAAVWYFLTPPLETLKTLSFKWVALILVRNAGLTFLFYGVLHFRLFMRKSQGKQFKYNPRWPGSDKRFTFGDQTHDNLFWTFCSGVPIWTAYETFALWAFANGYFPMIAWEGNEVYFVSLMLLLPLFREVHFYLVHRLIHLPALYRHIHHIHHRNTNPGPWSGLSMHPLEHLPYFSGVLIHFIIPAHPLHAMFQLIHAGISPGIGGHNGFDKFVVGDKLVDPSSHYHYLHHKYFECNYGGGNVPLDQWFGTFHDGSDETYRAMRKRLKEHKA